MNQQPFTSPPKFWTSKLSPTWVKVFGPWRRRTLRRDQGFADIEVRGCDPVRTALAEGVGVMITPNHSFHYDSYVMTEAAHRDLGRPVHFLTAWQVFAMSSRFEQWSLQRHGCFSIDRDGADLAAFRRAVDIVRESRFPLVVYPEGDIYHTNDRVVPFRDGAAAIALAAARKAGRKIVCVPCGVKCWYLDDPTASLARTMEQLERRLTLRPGYSQPLLRRIYRFAEVLLAVKEVEYLGRCHGGSVRTRVSRLIDGILRPMEADHGLTPKDRDVPERVKELRRVIIQQQAGTDRTPADRDRLRDGMDDLFFVVQMFSYPGDYVAENPTIERLAETIDKFEEDVLGAAYPTVRGRRKVVLEFGEPVEVSGERGKKDATGALTTLLETRVQGLLDGLNARAGTAASLPQSV